jgi:hypothetical protein
MALGDEGQRVELSGPVTTRHEPQIVTLTRSGRFGSDKCGGGRRAPRCSKRDVLNPPHPEERTTCASRSIGCLMLRDGAWRLLTMRAGADLSPLQRPPWIETYRYKKTYPRSLRRTYHVRIPPRTEGCLISIFRRGAGSGGRGMTSRWRCGAKARRSKPQTSRRASRAPRGPTDGGSRHGQKCWRPSGPESGG